MKNKHVKTFENFDSIDNNKYILVLRFKNSDEYTKAVDFFNYDSEFFSERSNDEFMALDFNCSDELDMNTTEHAIDKELIKNGFEGYYFEQE